MPNRHGLLNQISTIKTRVQNEPLWKSNIDHECACVQLNLSKQKQDTISQLREVT